MIVEAINDHGDNDLGNSCYPIFERPELAADHPAVNVLVYWDNLPDNDSAYDHVQHE